MRLISAWFPQAPPSGTAMIRGLTQNTSPPMSLMPPFVGSFIIYRRCRYLRLRNAEKICSWRNFGASSGAAVNPSGSGTIRLNGHAGATLSQKSFHPFTASQGIRSTIYLKRIGRHRSDVIAPARRHAVQRMGNILAERNAPVRRDFLGIDQVNHQPTSFQGNLKRPIRCPPRSPTILGS